MPDAIDTPWPDSGWFRTPGGRAARVGVAEPLAGIEVELPGGVDRLLGIDLATGSTPPPVVDRWCRGRDLTVVVEPDDVRLLRAAVRWRFLDASVGIDAWEAVVSAQTALLDSDATLSVVSEVAAAEVVAGTDVGWSRVGDGPLLTAATATLARRSATSVLVAVHPGDLRRVDVAIRDSVARIECRLFAATIEKGVLLRSRVLAAVGPRNHDEAWAARLLAEFAAAAPPLAT